MSLAHTQPPTSGKDDLRLAPALNLLWVGGGAPDAAAIGQAAALLQAAAHAAAARWPDVYHEPTRTRLVCRADDAPPAAALEAAALAGLEVDASGGGAVICDAALTPSSDFTKIPPSLPALVAAPGAPLQFAIDAGVGPPLAGAPRRREVEAATPEALAQTLLSPPRRVAERRKLAEYQGEDQNRRARRFEYALLLRLIGEPKEGASGAPDDAWERAAMLIGERASTAPPRLPLCAANKSAAMR